MTTTSLKCQSRKVFLNLKAGYIAQSKKTWKLILWFTVAEIFLLCGKSLIDVVSRKSTYVIVDQEDHRLFCSSCNFWPRKNHQSAKDDTFLSQCRLDIPSLTNAYCSPDYWAPSCTNNFSSKPVTWPKYVICQKLFFEFCFASGRQMRPNLTV